MVRPRSYFTSELRYQALKELGSSLRSARIKSGLSQEEAAASLSVSAQSIRNWEAGRHEPRPDALNRIKSLYGEFSPDIFEIRHITQDSSEPALRYNRIPADAEKLREARVSAGLTQAEVASKTGVSQNSIGRYENGQAMPTFSSLLKLAEAYATPPWGLIADGNESDVAHLFPYSHSSERVCDMIRDEVLNVYETVKANLSPESVRSIADYIRYIHQSDLDRQGRPGAD